MRSIWRHACELPKAISLCAESLPRALINARRSEIQLFRPLGLLVSGVRGFMRFCRMVVRKLGMLGRVCLVTLFMGFCGVPMRLGSFIVVGCGFVVVVFWHFISG
jgi:hypothetical protein